MISYKIRTAPPIHHDRTRVREIIGIFGQLLPADLSSKVDLDAYTEKVCSNAFITTAISGQQVLGLAIYYANNLETRTAHLPLIAVRPQERGQGIARSMLDSITMTCKSAGMKILTLETDTENNPAKALYKSFGFIEEEISQNRIKLKLFLDCN